MRFSLRTLLALSLACVACWGLSRITSFYWNECEASLQVWYSPRAYITMSRIDDRDYGVRYECCVFVRDDMGYSGYALYRKPIKWLDKYPPSPTGMRHPWRY
jgi:hypothetical protein